MKTSKADIIRELGPFNEVHGVTYDGTHVWFATGDRINAVNPETGEVVRAIAVPAYAGTAFDGTHIYQIAENRIQKVDPKTGKVLSSIPTPSSSNSGLTWAEGTLWIGQYRDRKILQLDPETGKVLRSIDSERFVTGVTWLDGELWHGTWEEDRSDLRRVDSVSAKAVETIEMPEGVVVSGLESDGKDRFFCGGSKSGKIRVVRRKA